MRDIFEGFHNRFGLVAGAISLMYAAAMLPTVLQAQSVSSPYSQVPTGSLNYPNALAVDGSGNLYVGNYFSGEVIKVTPAETATVINTQASGVDGLAVDNSGDLFLYLQNLGNIVKVTPDLQVSHIGSVGNDAGGLALDAAGDLFVSDFDNNRVVEITPSGMQTTVANVSQPHDVAVDAAGNLFVTANPPGSSGSIVKVPAGGGPQTTILNGLSEFVRGVAVDSAGNVFAVTQGDGVLWEAPAGGGTPFQLATGFPSLIRVRVNGAGDVYFSDNQLNEVFVLKRSSLNFGNANVCSGGQPLPSPCSQTMTLTFNVTGSGTLGTPQALTMGAPNLDFSVASATCSGAVTAGSTCTVNVTFAPRFPGARQGAIEIVDGSGNILSTTQVSGTGHGPQIAFSGAAQTTVATSYTYPTAIVRAGDGSLYLSAGETGGSVYKISGGSSTPVGSGLSFPYGLALDGAGNLYIADFLGDDVVIIAPDGSQHSIGGFGHPSGIAVDQSGNLYVSNTSDNSVIRVTPGGTRTTMASGLGEVEGIAVDASGNLFVPVDNQQEVLKITPDLVQSTIGSGWNTPAFVTVDGLGNVFVTDANAGTLQEVKTDGSQILIASNLSFPYGVALDDAGNLYAAELGNGNLVQINRSQPPSFNYLNTDVGGTSDSQSVAVENIGDMALAGQIYSIDKNFVQTQGSGTPEDCAASFSVAPGSACNLSLAFAPQSVGIINGSAILLDNSLNGVNVEHKIVLSGNSQQGSPVITLGNLNQAYTGSPLAVTATTVPAGLPVSFTYNGSATPPTKPGSYSVVATVKTQDYYGTVTGTFVISQATASVTLGNLTQTYTGSALSATATTTPANLSVSFTYNGSATAPTAPGSYAVVATINDPNYTGSASGNLVISKATATVTLGSLSQTYSGSALSATATTTPANLSVSLTYNGAATAPTAAGSYAVVATINDPNYTGSNSGTLVISKAAATVTLGNLTQTYTGSALSATATTTPANLSVSFTYNGAATAPTAAGKYTVVATINDPSYQGSTTNTMNINPATTTITWANPAPITYGSALGAAQLNATSSVPGAFTYTPVAGTVPGAGAQTLKVTFTPTDTTDYQSATASVTLSVNKATPTITWANPAAIIYGTPLSASQLNATANIAGTFAYNPAAGTVLGAGTQPLGASFMPADATDYNSVTSGVVLTVNKATQTITFGSIAAQVVGNTINLSASSNSGLAVSFASSTPSVCSVSGTQATMLSTGPCAIQASQAGNANYAAAAPVSVGFAVTSVSSFKLIATPNSETIHRGVRAAFLLEAQSVNGFSGNVKITCSGGPSTSVCANFPQTLSLQPNKLALAISGILFPKNTAPGTYTVAFTGASGSTVVSTTAQFKVQD